MGPISPNANKYLVSLQTTRGKSSLRPLRICAPLGRDPTRPNSNHLTTEVRVPKVEMSVNFKTWLKPFATAVKPRKLSDLSRIIILSNILQKDFQTIWTTKPRNHFKCFFAEIGNNSIFSNSENKWTASCFLARLGHFSKSERRFGIQVQICPLVGSMTFSPFLSSAVRRQALSLHTKTRPPPLENIPFR